MGRHGCAKTRSVKVDFHTASTASAGMPLLTHQRPSFVTRSNCLFIMFHPLGPALRNESSFHNGHISHGNKAHTSDDKENSNTIRDKGECSPPFINSKVGMLLAFHAIFGVFTDPLVGWMSSKVGYR